MKRIIVTGATGFVGKELVKQLNKDGNEVIPISFSNLLKKGAALLPEADVCIHLAARVHVMKDAHPNPIDEYRRINLEGTKLLANLASQAGIKRFIYMSTVKVMAESSKLNYPFTASDTPVPTDPYAISKLESENYLLDYAKASEMEVVIIRPPLIYGKGVKANFLSLMRAAAKRMPMPFLGINNLRSLVSLQNLTSFINCVIDHPLAKNEIFFVSDGEDVSIAELYKKISKALNVSPRVFFVPIPILRTLASIIGKDAAVDRLCESLQVDISKNKTILGWMPPYTLEHGILEMVKP
jgi:nucleoside-diphosphate-sugar epimerase